MNTITRKIQILLDEDENRKEHFNDIYRWQRICVKAANMISTAHYVQENIKDLFYMEDGTKKKLANIEKDEDGILTMSSANTTYQLLSRRFKGEAPMSMLSGLNNVVQKTYKKETIEVQNGKKSLRSYRDNIPMPVPSQQIRNITKTEKGYRFMIYGKSFHTRFGRDLSGNKLIFDKAVKGLYKLCDSSIQIKDGKMFLLAVFQFESEKPVLEDDKVMMAELSIATPIICYTSKNKPFKIGNAEEFLHRRIQIQQGLKRLQIASRYNVGGKGRKKKLASIEKYEEKEKNYVRTKLHVYSRMLIDNCVKNKCSKLVLVNQKEKEESAKEKELILRNWSYYGLKEFIEYKAKVVGIQVEYVDMEYEDTFDIQQELLQNI